MCSTQSGDRDVLDDVAALVAERNRIDARLARMVRTAQLTQAPERDGQRSMASWLRGHCRLSPAAAARTVTAGRVLEHLPVLAGFFAQGRVTAEQVAVIAPVAAPGNLTAAQAPGVDLAAVDALLAEVAVTRPHTDLAKVVHHHQERLDPDGTEPAPPRAAP